MVNRIKHCRLSFVERSPPNFISLASIARSWGMNVKPTTIIKRRHKNV